MIDPSKLPSAVRRDILENLDVDWNDEKDVALQTARLARMTPEQAFERWCEWHGFIGWGVNILHAIDTLRAAAVDPETEGRPRHD